VALVGRFGRSGGTFVNSASPESAAEDAHRGGRTRTKRGFGRLEASAGHHSLREYYAEVS
jgi:hypothetical protein